MDINEQMARKTIKTVEYPGGYKYAIIKYSGENYGYFVERSGRYRRSRNGIESPESAVMEAQEALAKAMIEDADISDL